MFTSTIDTYHLSNNIDMLINNPQFDNFKFRLSTDFFIGEKMLKFNKWLSQYNRNIDNIADNVNETIQGLQLSSYSIEPIVQTQPGTAQGSAAESSFVPHVPWANLIEDKILTVTMMHCEGFINYFAMLELYYYYADGGSKIEDFKPMPSQYIEILDNYGNLLFMFKTDRMLFIAIDGLELSKNKVEQEFATFDVKFKFDTYELLFNTPEEKMVHDS